MANDARADIRVGQQVIVQAIGPALHQRPQPRRAGGIVLPQGCRIDIEPLSQILPDRLFALGLGKPAECDEIIGLDPVEVILGLGVDHAEDGIGIGRAVDMGNAPIVARDLNALGSRRPSRMLGDVGLAPSRRGER